MPRSKAHYATFTGSNVIMLCPYKWHETFAANFCTELAGRMGWGQVHKFRKFTRQGVPHATGPHQPTTA